MHGTRSYIYVLDYATTYIEHEDSTNQMTLPIARFSFYARINDLFVNKPLGTRLHH